MKEFSQREKKMRVKKRTQERVYPASPSPGGLLELSVNDQMMPRHYVSLLFFFKQKPPQDAFFLLKASLAQALAIFYPCAGRYRERVNGELEIVCNDEGAVLHEAWVDCTYDHFLPDFAPHPDFPMLVPPVEPAAGISEIPLFLAQITHFECGNACIGTRLHHNVCDGLAMSHFLSAWAMLTKSTAHVDFQSTLELCFDRSLIKPNPLPSPSFNHPEYQTHTPIFLESWPPCTNKILSFTPSYMDALRASARPGPAPAYTRFETLAAHLWRGIMLTRGLEPHQDIRLGMAVDGRKRFNPPLPKGYFGNTVFFGFISTTAREVVESPPSFTADLVKDAIAKVSDMHMRSALDWIAKQESPKSVYVSFCTLFIDVSITSWLRFPLYDVDFGWGKPSFVRIPVSIFDGLIILLPSPLGEGHVDALVGLREEHMPKLEEYIKDALKAK